MGTQFTGLSSANFFPDPGPDLPRIYLRSNGNVEPATAPIEKSGNIYKLTDNIAMHTIVIQCDNIVLDGSGYLIQGNKSWMGTAHIAGNNGIIIEGKNNVNITNCSIEKFTVGFRISDSSNINIVGNLFAEGAAAMDTPAGIIIDDSSFVLIESNNFTRIQAISGSGAHLTIRRNTLTYGGITLEGSSNIISDNKIETVFEAIRLGLADLNLIARNNITGPISFVSCSNNRIFGNNMTGIRIVFGSNNTVYDNYLPNNFCSIELTQTVNNTFYGNTFALNCTVRFNDAGTNFWDNGTLGNYWNDYNGTDSNRDGISDSPYIITGVKWDNDAGGDVSFPIGQDNYPLMSPYDHEHEVVVLPKAEPFLAVIVTVAIAIVVGAGLLVFHRRKRRCKVEQA